MSKDDFSTILSCLMRVSWSGGAGKLCLCPSNTSVVNSKVCKITL